MKIRFGLVVAVSMLLAANVVRAQISNGGFEQPTTPPLSGSVTTFTSASQGIPGWTIVSGNVDLVATALLPSFEGNESINLNGLSPGAISQTFSTVLGQAYTLTFGYSNNPGSPSAIFTADVSVTGATPVLATTITHNTSTYDINTHTGSMNYNVFSQNFIANSTSSTVKFQSTSPAGPYGIVLDGIKATATPEFGSVFSLGGLLVAGGVGLWIKKRRVQ